MSKIDTGGPAYPKHTIGGFMTGGKTWLDDAAMQIAAGLESNSSIDWVPRMIADRAYCVARALLAEKKRLESDE